MTISALYVALLCKKPLSSLLPSPFYVIAYLCQFSLHAFYTFSYIVTFIALFSTSSTLQIIIPKIYLNPGMTNTVIATILFLAYDWDFCIVLNIPLFSLFRLSFVYLSYTSILLIPQLILCFCPHKPVVCLVRVKY